MLALARLELEKPAERPPKSEPIEVTAAKSKPLRTKKMATDRKSTKEKNLTLERAASASNLKGSLGQGLNVLEDTIDENMQFIMNMGLDWTAEKSRASAVKERAKSALKSVVSKTSNKLLAK